MRAARVCLLAVLLPAGCSTTHSSALRSDGQVQLAIRSIESGQASQADQALARLEKVRPAYAGEDADYVNLLMAEAYLVKGLSMDALALAREVLDESPDDPRANEVAGKALLQMDKYADAEQRFVDAQTAVTPGGADDRRLEDLINVARGLAAYARAETNQARQHWDSIVDPQIRFQVDEAIRAETIR